MCFLREIYGASVEKVSDKSGKTVDVSTISSNFHIEINPSDVAHQDYFVVRELLKEIALTQQLDTSIRSFKVVVISEADKLTRKAQQALRRIMEKYAANCRYILCCNSPSKVLAPIRSRCLAIRVPAPTVEEICEVLQAVSKKENVRLPAPLAMRMAVGSGRSLRKVLLALETCKVAQQSTVLPEDAEVPISDWERYVVDTALMIIEDQTPQRLLQVRARLYELLSHCIPADVIIKNLTRELIKNVDQNLKVERGRKAIYHLEAFVAKFMSIYKRFLLELMS